MNKQNKQFNFKQIVKAIGLSFFMIILWTGNACAQTAIYRSVGFGSTTAIETGSGNDLTISSGTATFASAVDDNIGVGDVIQYDDDNDGDIDADDSLAFITGRTSSTVFTVQAADGSAPTNTATNDQDWSIFRAYTSLANAEAGTENTGIDDDLEQFDSAWSGSGGKDISSATGSNEVWNIALYADAANTTATDIDGWTTSTTNYLKIFVPSTTSEVGTLQRHSGKWDTTKAYLEYSSITRVIRVSVSNVILDGLQIHNSNTNTGDGRYSCVWSDSAITGLTISNSILNANAGGSAIVFENASIESDIINTVVYSPDSQGANSEGINVINASAVNIYNATVYNFNDGIERDAGTVTVTNSAVFGNNDDFDGTMTQTYNASDDGDGTNAVTPSDWSDVFVDYTNYNFHLKATDTDLREAGSDLSGTFTDDIDGNTRPTGTAWDIGADEGSTAIYRSVGFGSTTAIETGSGNDLTISSGSATFASAVADNIGVGDVIQYDDDNDGDIDADDSLAFIKERVSSTVFRVQTAAGGVPTDTAADDQDWDIFRAYASLSNAEAGTENTGIDDDLEQFDASWSGSGGKDIAAANEQWNIALYADGTDTTAVDIVGWTTSSINYLKLYTPVSSSEVGTSQRHDGTAGSGYKIDSAGISIDIYSSYTRVEGLETDYIRNENNTTGEIHISHNLVYNGDYSIYVHVDTGSVKGYIYNNIVYDTNTGIYTRGAALTAYVYNNTVVDAAVRNFRDYEANTTAINNIAHGCVACFSGTFESTSNNLSDDPSLIFEDEASNNFHLGLSDNVAREKGADLSSDSNFAFSDDVDGNTRPTGATWDIGADEGSTAIYRSVGFGSTTALAVGAGNDLTISSGTATFTTTPGLNVGVGDVIQYDDDNDGDIDADDSLAFITGRTSATVFTVQASDGSTPSDTAANDQDWSVFRAYTALANAESGTENTGIDDDLEQFDSAWSGDGGRNIYTNNEQWNIACYGDAVETTAVTIDDWTTSATNYIKIYTPVSTSEVGITQRHSGKWDDSKYRMATSNSNAGIVYILDDYTRVEGLQIENTYTGDSTNRYSLRTQSNFNQLSHNILKGSNQGAGSVGGVGGGASYGGNKWWNNIFYDFGNACYTSSDNRQDIDILYNNTAYNCETCFAGLASYKSEPLLINNIAQNCTDGYESDFDSSSDFNISDVDASDAPNAKFTSDFATVSFANASAKDFRLAAADISARDVGTTLSSDSNLSFTDDISGDTRPLGAEWDIGADEASVPIFRSVGATVTNLNTDSRTITVSGSTVTFSGDMPTNVGVGDALVYNDGVASLAFIHARTSASVFTIKDKDGSTPNAASTGTAVNVYRAYASLNNFGNSTENSNITEPSENDVIPPTNLVSNNLQLNVACYGDATDTANAIISGWTTDVDNFIKIYTPTETTEVGVTQRHSGVWDATKYNLVVSTNNFPIQITSANIRVEGLQIEVTSLADKSGIEFDDVTAGEYYASYNIIRSTADTNSWDKGITFASDEDNGGSVYAYFYNNIISDFIGHTADGGIQVVDNGDDETVYAYIYNNTLVGNYHGIDNDLDSTDHVDLIKNNLAFGNTDDYEGTFDGNSVDNAYSEGADPGTSGVDISGVAGADLFVDYNNGDYRIKTTSTMVGAGSNVSSDDYLPFSDDISGDTRPAGALWDIGADEAPVAIFRSVGPSNTTTLESGAGNDLTISSGSATFASAVANNIGVGDVIQYDDDNDGDIDADDSLAFIKERVSSTVFRVQTASGGVPTDTAANDQDWDIFRAYTSLANAEAGTENTGIDDDLENFDDWTTRDLVANNEQWNIACYADASDGSVTVNGFTTSETNYLKIYTPVSTSEVGESQRHSGKWDATKFRLQGDGAAINNDVYNIRVEGLQFYVTNTSSGSRSHISLDPSGSTIMNAYISDNIFRFVNAGSNSRSSVNVGSVGASGSKVYVWNNIFYGAGTGSTNMSAIRHNYNSDATVYVYNNTIYDFYYGIETDDGNPLIAINNIVQGASVAYYNGGSWGTGTGKNISNDATAPGTSSQTNTTVTFEDLVNRDFHLSPSDKTARDKGADLSSNSNLAFSDDAEGDSRALGQAWDIGADEAATAIFRSVGFGSTTAVATGAGNDLTISSGTATFASAPGTTVGVGDAIQYDDDNDGDIDTNDSIAFITGRTSSTVYTVQAADGTWPTDTAANDQDWSIFRAYTTLANAETGTENAGIDDDLEQFDTAWSGSGGKDISSATGSNEQWNIALYADAAETTPGIDINGWTTDANNYIKLYTPTDSTEVGTSQRHNGAWDESKYYMSISNGDGIRIDDDYVKVDGLQIQLTLASHSFDYAFRTGADDHHLWLSNNIFKGVISGTSDGIEGVALGWSASPNEKIAYVWNNIFYGWRNGANNVNAIEIGDTFDAIYLYNNTVYDSYIGFNVFGSNEYLFNNITQNCTDGYDGTPNAISDYNISDVNSTDAPNATFTADFGSVTFIDYASGNFLLSSSDTIALNKGTDLSADNSFAFTMDIQGESRPIGAAWDIGADERAAYIFDDAASGDWNSGATWGNAGSSEGVDYPGPGDSITLDTGTVTLTATQSVGDIEISGGGITFGANTLNVAGSWTYSSGTVTLGTGSVNLNAATGTQTITSGGQAFNNLTIDGNNGSATYQPIDDLDIDGNFVLVEGTLDLATNNPDVQIAGDVTLTSGTYTKGTGTVLFNGDLTYYDATGTTNIGKLVIGTSPDTTDLSSDMVADSLTINSGDILNTNGYDLDVAGDIDIFGTLDTIDDVETDETYINLAGTWTNTGTFIQDQSSVTFDGANQSVTGSTTFYNFVKIDSADDSTDETLTFDNTSLQTMTGTLTLDGLDSNDMVNLVSDSPGSAWELAATGTWTINYVEVTDSDNSAGTELTHSNTTDGGGNANWGFPVTAIYRSVGFGSTSAIESGGSNALTITSGTATFVSAVADNIGVGDVIQYDDDDDGDIDADDSLAFITARTSSTEFTVQTASGGVPTDTAAPDQNWDIFRAYTSLYNAEAGTENTGLDDDLEQFDTSWSGSGGKDLTAANQQWNIACYADATDTVSVDIDGWTTSSANYMKIYTPVNSSEVGVTQRHNGRWDPSKYNIVASDGLWGVVRPMDNYIRVEGLQVENTNSGGSAAGIGEGQPLGGCRAEDNIVRSQVGSGAEGITFPDSGNTDHNYAINNIVYGFATGIYIRGPSSSAYGIVYNNTVVGSTTSYRCRSNYTVVKNNISFNSTTSFLESDNCHADSDNNAGDNVGPTNDGNYIDLSSNVGADIFADYNGEDYRLAAIDVVARDKGLDLSSDSHFAFTDDIEGNTRAIGSGWDIGADEAQIALFRSVGATQTNLNTDSRTVTITGTTVTFSGDMPTTVGVGDAITYDSGGNQLAFIHQRSSATVFYAKDKDGGTPTTAPALTAAGVYRVYPTIATWNSQSENSNITEPTENDVNPDQDLVTNKTQINVSLFADAAETVTDSGIDITTAWTTGQYNYIKLYTPVSSNEVGITQRHNGKWDDTKYNFTIARGGGGNATGINSQVAYTRLEGIQMAIGGDGAFRYGYYDNSGYGIISHNIFKNTGSQVDASSDAIRVTDAVDVYIYNNIVYDCSACIFAGGADSSSFVYHNTVHNCSTRGFGHGYIDTIYKNNIAQDCTDGYSNDAASTSDYNISDISATDAPNATFTDDFATVDFVDEADDDFHLLSTDTSAKDQGTDLSNDTYLIIADDIDQESRSGSWDIGADEYVTGTISIAGTVYSDEGVTDINENITVAVSVNGAAAAGTDDTTTDGGYTISGITAGYGDVLTLYLEDESPNGVTVTKADGNNLAGMDIYQNFLIARDETGGSLTNANFEAAETNGDGDISAIYSVASSNLTTVSGIDFLVASGHTFAPGGNVNIGTASTTSDLRIKGTWTAANGETIYARGDLYHEGTFNGASVTMELDDDLYFNGGTFTATSTSIDLADDLTYTAGVFDGSTGTVGFNGGSSRTITPGSMTFNDVVINSGTYNFVVVGEMDVDGTLSIVSAQALSSGSISISGDVVTVDTVLTGGATINFNGSGSQTLSANGSYGELPAVTINKSSGTFYIQDNVGPYEDWTYIAGDVDAGSSTVTFQGGSTKNVDSRSMTFNDVVIDNSTYSILLTETMDVNGDLTITAVNGISSGTIALAGDLLTTDSDVSSSSGFILFDGTGNQTVSADGGYGEIPGVKINKSGGTLTFQDSVGPHGSWTHTAGEVDTSAGTIVFQGTSGSAFITSNTMTFNDVEFTNTGYSAYLQDDMDIDGNLTLTSIVNLGNYEFQVAGDLIVTDNDVNFSGAGSIILDGIGSQTVSFSTPEALDSGPVWINKTAGSVSLESDWTLDTGASNSLVIVEGTFNINGNAFTASSGTFEVQDGGYFELQGGEVTTAPTLNAGSTVIYSGSSSVYTVQDWSYSSIAFNNSTGSFNLSNDLDIPGNLTISAGTLDLTSNNYQINLEGDWNNDGMLIARAGTVTFDGLDTSHSINGSTTFYDFVKVESDNDSTDEVLTFDSAGTQTIEGTLTLDGRDNNDRLNLISSSSGTQWGLNVTGSVAIDYVDVMDSDASGGILITHTQTDDGGNNSNWGFNVSISGTVYIDEGITNIGAAKTVAISIGGAAAATTAETDANGDFTLSGFVANTGNVITIYVDDETEDAVMVNLATGGTMTGMDLYKDRLILRNDGGFFLTNANLETAETNGDADIGALYYVASDNFYLLNDKELFVDSSAVYAPGGDVHVGAGGVTSSFDIDGTFTDPGSSYVLSIEGTVDFSGAYNGSDGFLDVDDDFIMTAGSFTAPTAIINVEGDMTISGGAFVPGDGTVRLYAGTKTVDVGSTIFNDVEISQFTTLTIAGSMDIDGTLSFGSGISNINSGTLYVAGDVVTIDSTIGGSGTVVFNGSGAQNLSVDGVGGHGDLPHVEINKSGGTLTISDDIGVDGNWTYYSGSVDAGTSTISFEDSTKTVSDSVTLFNDVDIYGFTTFTVGSGSINIDGDLRFISGLSDINGGYLYVAGNVSSTDVSLDGTGTVLFDGAGAQTLWTDGVGGGGSFPNIEINKPSGTLTLGDHIYVANDWTHVQGTVDAGTSTVRFTDKNKTVDDQTTSFSDVDIQTLTNLTITGDLDIDGNLTITSLANIFGGSVSVAGDLTISDADVDLESGAIINFDGANSQTFNLSSAGAFDTGAIRIDKTAGELVMATDLTLSSGASNSLVVVEGTFDINGNTLSVTGGTFEVQDGGVYQLFGDETTTAPTINTGSTISYDGVGSYTGLLLGDSYSNLRFNGGGTWDLDADLDVDGDFTLAAGTVDVTASNFTITVAGDWDNNANFTEQSGSVYFDGTSAQTIANNSSSFNDVVVTNTGANVTFSEAFNAADFTASAGSSLVFAGNSTFGLTGTLTLDGTPSNKITTDSNTFGSPFTLSVTGGAQTISYTSVANSYTDGYDITANYSMNSGNTDSSGSSPHWVFPSTEFVSVIKEDGTGDYTTLSAWESAIDTDLSISATGNWDGQTGSDIADGAAVTWDAGGSTGTLRHMTTTAKSGADAFLIEISSGSLDDNDTVDDGGGNTFDVAGTPTAAQATAKIDGTWSAAEPTTGLFQIFGWTTDETHYLKIYTTAAARHDGKWNDMKYRYKRVNSGNYGTGLSVRTHYVTIDGLQIEYDNSAGFAGGSAISGDYINGRKSELRFSNNIIRASSSDPGSGFNFGNNSFDEDKTDVFIYNNLIYDFATYCVATYYSNKGYVYNNTVHNCGIGYRGAAGTLFKNNIAQDSTNGFFNTIYDATSDYNVSDISGDAYNVTFADGFATVTFEDEANDDFHLSTSDTAAQDKGTDLTSDSLLPFATDIDGATRTNTNDTTWDIGADEVPTTITNTIMAESGDYATLFAWEDAQEDYLSGNLVSENLIQEAKIDGAWFSADTLAAHINGFSTGHHNYVRIYTTDAARHDGRWNEGKYRIEVTDDYGVRVSDNHVKIEGLQIFMTLTGATNYSGILVSGQGLGSEVSVLNSVVKASISAASSGYNNGIRFDDTELVAKAYNNVVYDVTGTNNPGRKAGFRFETLATYLYNNTVYNSGYAFNDDGGTSVLKNNIAQVCDGDCYQGTFDGASDYNISDVNATDAPNLTFADDFGTVTFVDESGDDFHLSTADTVAQNVGTFLTSDTYLPITTDIDGATRTTTNDTTWDIGADEVPTTITSTIMESGGDYTTLAAWEDAQDDYLSGDLLGENLIQVAQVDGTWTNADTSRVDIDGWTSTGHHNYIKVYTTTAARHDGRWNNKKYRLQIAQTTTDDRSCFDIDEKYVRVDGLQMRKGPITTFSGNDCLTMSRSTGEVQVSNNICWMVNNSTYGSIGFTGPGSTVHGIYKIWNNIIYDVFNTDNDDGEGIRFNTLAASTGRAYFYNNTIVNSYNGFWINGFDVVAKNNVVQCDSENGSFTDYVDFGSYFKSGTEYNLSSDGTAEGSNVITSTTLTFVDKANDDFHLSETDTAAINVGTFLTSDTYLPVTKDIDGATRTTTNDTVWDLGADEVPTTITSTVMESGGDYDSLSAWEDAQDSYLSGDLLGENLIQVAQIDGAWAGADTTAVNVDDWTSTGHHNYIRIYTTSSARHDGKWNTGKYRLALSAVGSNVLRVGEDYVRVDGLQVDNTAAGDAGNVRGLSLVGGEGVQISNNIIQHSGGGTLAVNDYGLFLTTVTDDCNVKIWNNVIYNYYSGITYSYGADRCVFAIYNNTVANMENGYGIFMQDSTADTDLYLKNNLVFNTPDDYNITNFTTQDYDYNLGEDAAFTGDDNYVVTSQTGTALFNDYDNDDFHLKTGSDANNVGLDVLADSYLAVTLDIDGDTRTGDWDIGADHFALSIFNAVATGNWNQGATWGNAGNTEGVDYPGASDSASIDGSAITMTANQSAGNVTFAGGQLNFGVYTLNVDGDWTYSSGTVSYGTGSVNFNAASGTKIITSGGQTFNNVTFDDSDGSASWQLADDLDVNGDFIIVDGTLNTNDQSIYIANSATLQVNATFTKGAGTVYFDGTSNAVTDNTVGGQDWGNVRF